jgi:hypothetical protein
MMVLRKTNYSVTIQLDDRNTPIVVMSQLNKALRQLAGLCDLYPCPKTYALLAVMKSRMVGVSLNDLLDRYWFPTCKILSLADKTVRIKLSLPPVNQQK